MVVVYFLWFYFVCSFYVALRETFKAKAWERICRRQVFLDKISTRIHKLLLSSLQIAPVGGKIIEVNSTLQLQVVVVWKRPLNMSKGVVFQLGWSCFMFLFKVLSVSSHCSSTLRMESKRCLPSPTRM